jgi:Uma2 family endonuclease
LRSRTDSLKDLQKKMQEYIQNGAKLGWLIDRKNKQVEMYRPGREIEILDNPLILSGEDILPGFILDLSMIL